MGTDPRRSAHTGALVKTTGTTGKKLAFVMKKQGKRSDQTVRRNSHERFVRDAIARSLLTLPFAYLDAKDPLGEVYGYYSQLQESAESGELPPSGVLTSIIQLVGSDATTHENCFNYTKADIERRWCEGLLLHFSWGQELVTP